jgi:drug/metabolite transporter (DMT)-like permease
LSSSTAVSRYVPLTRGELAGIGLALASATAFGTMPVLAKLAFMSGLGTQQTLALRFLFAATGMLVLAVVLRQNPLRLSTQRVTTAWVLGAVGYCAQALTFFLALQTLPASFAVMVSYTYPTLVVLSGWLLLGRSITAMQVVAVIGTLAGVVLLLGGIHFQITAGLLFAIASPIAYTVYILVGEKLMGRSPAFETSTIVISGAAFAFCMIAAFTGELRLPSSAYSWAIIIGVALVPTMLAISLFLAALPRVGAGRASVISTWEPVVTVALAFALLGERLSPLQFAGAVVVLLGVVVMQWPRARPVP